MKRTLGILLAVIMLLSCTSAAFAQVQPIAEGDPTTLTFLTASISGSVIDDYNDNVTLQEIEKLLNVKIEWNHAPSGQLNDKINTMIAAMDLPDIIDSFNDAYAKGPDDAIEQGIILRLNELIDQYAPDFKAVLEAYPEARRQVTTDSGNIWAFPCLQPKEEPSWRGPCIRQDLLDEYGLKVPTSIAELEKVLYTFKEKGVEVPLYCNPVKDAATVEDGFIISAFDMGPRFYMKPDANGKQTVHYYAMDDQFKAYLELMKKWYDDGILDKEFDTRDGDSAESIMTQGKVGVYASGRGYGPTLRIQTNARKNGDENFTLELFPNLPLENGGEVHYRQTNFINKSNNAVITTSCENPELAVKYLNFGYSEEGAMFYNYGLEGLTYTIVDGKPQFTEYVTNNPDGYGWTNLRESIKRHTGSYLRDWTAFPATEFELRCMNTWSLAGNDYVMPPVSRTAEESTRYAKIMGDVKVYVEECVAGFITGAKPISEFESFRSVLSGMGVEEAIQIQQAALDRYYQR